MPMKRNCCGLIYLQISLEASNIMIIPITGILLTYLFHEIISFTYFNELNKDYLFPWFLVPKNGGTVIFLAL